jgi:hypothetical protein
MGTSAEFAPVGDEDGLLVLVAVGRPWYPTDAVVAGPLPLTVDLAVAGQAELSLGPVASLRATAVASSSGRPAQRWSGLSSSSASRWAASS